MTADRSAGSIGAGFDRDLRRQSRTSVGWSVVRFMSDQLFSFLIFVVLARLLTRSDVGSFALMAIFAEVVRTISTAGLIQTVARERVLSDEFLDTVYRSHLSLSLAACLVIVAVAHPFAAFMDAPQIAIPLQVLSLALPIAALGQTHMALRLRDFGHKTTALRSVLSGVIGGGAAVASAFAGLGLWSLVIQRLVSEIVGAVLSRASYDWTPGKKFCWGVWKRNIGLNGSLTASELSYIVTQRLPELVIGSVIGVAAVGVYRTAWRTVELVSNGAIRPFSTVAIHTLSRVKGHPRELRHAYQWMISKASAVSLPALVGFGSIAPLAVPTVFGDKWQEAGELGQIFAFMALPFTLNLFASPSFGALGASKTVLFVSMCQLVTSVVFTFLAAPYGLQAVVWAYVLRAYVTLPLQIGLLKRVSGIGFNHTVAAIWQPFVASIVMGVVIYFALPWSALLTPNAWLRLPLLAATGALIYGLVLLTISPTWRALFVRTVRFVIP